MKVYRLHSGQGLNHRNDMARAAPPEWYGLSLRLGPYHSGGPGPGPPAVHKLSQCPQLRLLLAAARQNQQYGLCVQRRIGSADQSSVCAQWVAKDSRFLHAHREDTDHGWSESSLGAQVILLVCRALVHISIWLASIILLNMLGIDQTSNVQS